MNATELRNLSGKTVSSNEPMRFFAWLPHISPRRRRDRSSKEIIAFVDCHREQYGVELICKVLPIASSLYHEHKRREQYVKLVPERVRQDEYLSGKIITIWEENRSVYGVRKVWTTRPEQAEAQPLDLVNRNLTVLRPNQLWVADFTFVATWTGVVYTAFVIDVFSRMIIGWKVSSTMQTDLVLDALEQALWRRQVKGNLIHHSDRGSQYLSIRYIEHLAENGVVPSVGSVGSSHDNAMAETIICLYKTEVINREGPWKKLEAVELATMDWVDWFNNRRLMEPIGDIPPAVFEQLYYNRQQGVMAMQA